MARNGHVAFNTILANYIQDLIKTIEMKTVESQNEGEKEFIALVKGKDEWRVFVEGELAERNRLNTQSLYQKKNEPDSDSEEFDFQN